MTQESVRPAYYALRGGGWRDYVTLLHVPYTLWNLAYVALGAGLAPQFHLDRMLWAMAAFFLALGVAAHALDELNGRPLQTRIPSAALVALAVVGLGGALAIGVGAAVAWGYGLLVFVAIGGIVVPVYNLELLGGVLHNELGLALSWGGLTVLSSYWVEAQTLRVDAILAAVYGTVSIVAQRTLSTPVREARRKAGDPASVAPLERTLRLLAFGNIVLGAAVVAARLRWLR
ncbi:MAG: hypothetical protein ACXVZ2_09900 [Gaiellaceae bacterium]